MTLQNKKITGAERLNSLRKQAKKDISIAGTVQFRVDEETMLLLMEIADRKKLPLGTMVLMWTVERLSSER
ncbi:MAG: hypothetical protein C0508_12725 [Cyanobacteria bacterium PR.023]|nr:hypothetical protein [Cyanobacteria bacterium PR.023]